MGYFAGKFRRNGYFAILAQPIVMPKLWQKLQQNQDYVHTNIIVLTHTFKYLHFHPELPQLHNPSHLNTLHTNLIFFSHSLVEPFKINMLLLLISVLSVSSILFVRARHLLPIHKALAMEHSKNKPQGSCYGARKQMDLYLYAVIMWQ